MTSSNDKEEVYKFSFDGITLGEIYPLTVGGLSVSLLIARSRSGMHLDVARWS